MIIELLISLIYKLMSSWLFFEIPPLPEEIYSYIEVGLDWISKGAGIVANFVPLEYLFVLFGVILAIDVGVAIYHFVIWIIKKIPFLSIE